MHRKDPIRVLCVDDNPMIGEAVSMKLRPEDGFVVLKQLMNADDLVEQALQQAADIVLLDIDMPGADPFQAMQELEKRRPEARVIMLSGHVRRDLVDQAFEAGAWGYLSKDNDVQNLPDVVRRVAAGAIVLGPDVEAVMQ